MPVEKTGITFTVGKKQHIKLVADAYGNKGQPTVILAHGGGQTRHAWGKTAETLAKEGHYAIALDLRGHGESDWDAEANYAFSDYAQDIKDVVDQLQLPAKPAAVGASLGGISSLISHHQNDLFSKLVLVDITPRIELDGLGRIRDFMLKHAEEGFTSLDEAADFVASYTPERKRSKNNEGLKKNLRLCDDGRYRWHWDPRFFQQRPNQQKSNEQGEGHVKFDLMEEAAKSLTIPALLVRGKISDLVSPEGAKEFLDLVPHADFVDIEEAGHMVAGDKNDIFSAAVIDFLCQ